jgi:hypothetical protein
LRAAGREGAKLVATGIDDAEGVGLVRKIKTGRLRLLTKPISTDGIDYPLV